MVLQPICELPPVIIEISPGGRRVESVRVVNGLQKISHPFGAWLYFDAFQNDLPLRHIAQRNGGRQVWCLLLKITPEHEMISPQYLSEMSSIIHEHRTQETVFKSDEFFFISHFEQDTSRISVGQTCLLRHFVAL
jgi:hypothetical protein